MKPKEEGVPDKWNTVEEASDAQIMMQILYKTYLD
jgi:hypothetical protein